MVSCWLNLGQLDIITNKSNRLNKKGINEFILWEKAFFTIECPINVEGMIELEKQPFGRITIQLRNITGC